MTVDVRFHKLQASPWLEQHVLRRLERRLSRYRHRIGRVVIRLADVNGPKGGIDKRCRVEVRGRELGSFAVTESGSDIYATVDIALRRLAHTMGRKVDRRRKHSAVKLSAA